MISKEVRQIQGLDQVKKVDLFSRARHNLEMRFLNSMTEIVDPKDNLRRINGMVREGDFPIFISNHTQHANFIGFEKIRRAVGTSLIEEFYIAIAYSLVNEGQKEDFIKFARAISPTLEREGTYFVPLIRPQDLEKMSKERPDWRHDPVIRQRVHEHGNNMKFIEKRISLPGNGFALFPEATTEGGTKDENGEYIGMIDYTHPMLTNLITESIKVGRNIVVVPLGMVDFNKIVEARKTDYNGRVLWWGVRETIADYLTVQGRKPAKVVVGDPIRIDDMFDDGIIYEVEGKLRVSGPDIVNHYFSTQIRTLLPQHLRGKEYRDVAV